MKYYADHKNGRPQSGASPEENPSVLMEFLQNFVQGYLQKFRQEVNSIIDLVVSSENPP